MISVVGILVISTAMTVSSTTNDDAITALTKASYIHLGIDKTMIELQKKYVPKELEKYASPVTFVYKLGVEHKVSIEWTF